MPPHSILADLLGNVAMATFLDEHYLKLPFAGAGTARMLTQLATWATVEGILRQLDADMLVGRDGESHAGETPRSLDDVRRLLGEGFTIGIRHADRNDAGLAELAAEFHRALAAPIDIHLYCTPHGSPGFGWHYDAEEVFVVQTEGEKEWWLRKNTVNPWPLVETIPRDQNYPREIMPVMRCLLAAGDWLYIPGGYWHRTQAGAESISLSIGVRARTAVDFYDFLRGRLLHSIEWRQRLPSAGMPATHSDEELLKQHRDILRPLAAALGGMIEHDDLLMQFIAECRTTASNTTNPPG